MSAPLTVSVCGNCDYRAYPPRLLCPRCGSSEWRPQPAEAGIVTEVTELLAGYQRRQLPSGEWLEVTEEPPRLVTVRADAGVHVVARVPAGVEVGDRVRLFAGTGRVTAVPEERP
ncbi:MAG: zinc ribbon domain-containing protein [Solirubrobacterales bacterium]